jgi:hypothetical protein
MFIGGSVGVEVNNNLGPLEVNNNLGPYCQTKNGLRQGDRLPYITF